jgi:cyclopropane fatty-acyl-phospholipid synthase-like methyltransferase
MIRLPKLLSKYLYKIRSGMKDGMTLLDLGCGWGSVALYFAEKFKKSRFAFCYKEHYFR